MRRAAVSLVVASLALLRCSSSTAPTPGPAGCLESTAPPPTGTPSSYYVSSGGSTGGTGTSSQPWDLQTALDGGHGVLQPGDTVWLRGGVYCGQFKTVLNGTDAQRIVFRQYPGEQATIDGTLRAGGSYLTFWGFEIRQSNPLAVQNYVLQAYTANGRFINLVLHDAGISGVSMSADAGGGVELYGSLIYNNGSHENLDHGIYAHNATGSTKYIHDNVFFNNYARGIQIYEGGGNPIGNFQVVGNVSFNNGTISASSTENNLLISAPATTSAMVALDNLLYFSPGVGEVNLRLGNYGAQYNKDVLVQGTYAAGGAMGLQMENRWDQATIQDNTLIGASQTDVVLTGGDSLGARYVWSNNHYYRDPAAMAWGYNGTDYDFAGWQGASGLGATDVVTTGLPTATQIFVRPNVYEPGRATIVVYNWGNQGSVAVDVSGIVQPGQPYQVHNVQDIFGPPVASGSYGGGTISVPMTGVQPPAPLGRQTPQTAPRTGPDFDVFILTSGAP